MVDPATNLTIVSLVVRMSWPPTTRRAAQNFRRLDGTKNKQGTSFAGRSAYRDPAFIQSKPITHEVKP